MKYFLILLILLGFTATLFIIPQAFAEESGITYDVFDNPPKFFGDNLIIASPGKSIDGVLNAGGISVIDVSTNSLLYTINNPDPTEHDVFGRNIAISDSYIIVGVQGKTPVYGNYISSEIYVFDGKTGSLLYTIKNPNEGRSDIKFQSSFGRSIVSIGDDIAAGSYIPNSDNFATHLLHVFDGKTGSLLYTLDSPIPGSVSFGEVFESFDGKLAVYTRDEDPNDEKIDDAIYVFDGKTGSLLYTINDPSTNTDSDFGVYFTIINDNIVVGVPVWGSDNRFSGVIHVFDGNTGSLLSTINDPEETERDFDRRFGEYVVPAGNNIAVRSSGVVYIFEGTTGELLYTVDHPNLSNVELDMILDSLDGLTDYSLIILAVSVVVGGVALGIFMFKKMKKL
jgi:hypothetical protein